MQSVSEKGDSRKYMRESNASGTNNHLEKHAEEI